MNTGKYGSSYHVYAGPADDRGAENDQQWMICLVEGTKYFMIKCKGKCDEKNFGGNATLFVKADNDRFRLEDKGLYLFAGNGSKSCDENQFSIIPSDSKASKFSLKCKAEDVMPYVTYEKEQDDGNDMYAFAIKEDKGNE